MSMTPHEPEAIPEATRRLMQKACPKGTLATRLRDALVRSTTTRILPTSLPNGDDQQKHLGGWRW